MPHDGCEVGDELGNAERDMIDEYDENVVLNNTAEAKYMYYQIVNLTRYNMIIY